MNKNYYQFDFNMQRHLDMLLQGHPLEICFQTWEILAIVQ